MAPQSGVAGNGYSRWYPPYLLLISLVTNLLRYNKFCDVDVVDVDPPRRNREYSRQFPACRQIRHVAYSHSFELVSACLRHLLCSTVCLWCRRRTRCRRPHASRLQCYSAPQETSAMLSCVVSACSQHDSPDLILSAPGERIAPSGTFHNPGRTPKAHVDRCRRLHVAFS